MANWIFLSALFILGSIIGSFLNVCIFRIPAKKSVVWPGSHCGACLKPIPFYHNIPLLSYLMLGGKCRYCRAPLSRQYFIVELLTPLMLLVLFNAYGISAACVLAFVFAAALIVVTFIDLRHQIIPDVISLPGIPIFFLGSFVVPWVDPLQSLIGILAGGGILYLFALGYQLLTRKEGMGGGDIKLLAMIGAFLGWQGALTTLMLGAFGGSLIGVGFMLLRGKNLKYAIPFGPFLAGGALCSLLYGRQLISWYLSIGR